MIGPEPDSSNAPRLDGGAARPRSSPRLALFALEALPNAGSIRRFLVEHADDICFVGLSDAGRPAMGGFIGQAWRHLRRSGLRLVPYLAVNFAIPDAVSATYAITRKFRRRPRAAEATPIRYLCERHRIPWIAVDDVNGSEVADCFAVHRPDLIVSFHFDQIFTGATLALAPLGGLNVHPSLLPRHRGPTPTIHALAEQDPTFGVTVHRLVGRIDAGTILRQASERLPADVSASRAAILLHDRGRLLLDEVLDDIAEKGLPTAMEIATLPYCPYPSPTLLRELRRRGRRLTTWRDLMSAVGLS